MSLHVACPGCGKSFTVNDAAAGKKGRCKDCGVVFQLPLLQAREIQTPRNDLFDDLPTPKATSTATPLPPRTGGGSRERESYDPPVRTPKIKKAKKRRSQNNETDPLYYQACQILGSVFVLRIFVFIAMLITRGQVITLEIARVLDGLLGIGWLLGIGMLAFSRPASLFQGVVKYGFVGLNVLAIVYLAPVLTGTIEPPRGANSPLAGPPPIQQPPMIPQGPPPGFMGPRGLNAGRELQQSNEERRQQIMERHNQQIEGMRK